MTDERQYPDDFPKQAIDVLDTFQMNHSPGVILRGSASLRSQLYAGDYDAEQRMYYKCNTMLDAAIFAERQFKRVVRRCSNIVDIKVGEIDSFNILHGVSIVDNEVLNYNQTLVLTKLNELHDIGVIRTEDYADKKKLVVPHPTVKQYLAMKDAFKYHILRWTPSDIKKGTLRLYHNRTIRLFEALMLPGLTKIDVVSPVLGNMTDFSCIFLFFNKNKPMNVLNRDFVGSIKENIQMYLATDNYYKAAKRIFSLARFLGRPLDKILAMINSTEGILYKVSQEIGAIQNYLVKNVPTRMLKQQVDGFRIRLATVYKIPADILGKLDVINKASYNKKGRTAFANALADIDKHIQSYLSKTGKDALREAGFIPLPRWAT